MGLFNSLFGKKSFFLRNEDTGAELQGQFSPQNLIDNRSANYSKTSALNSNSPITQFVNGELNTITFDAMFFNRDFIFAKAADDIDTLNSWIARDPKLSRPPILSFSVGNGYLSMGSCVLTGLTKSFMEPTIDGNLRGVTCSLTLERYKPYSIEGNEPGETRYHIAKENDYYEMLTYDEYGSPEMGDIIRKRHPDKLEIEVADVIKLPSVEAIRNETIEQKSNVFRTAYGKKNTEQRRLRLYMLEKRNYSYVSHIVK